MPCRHTLVIDGDAVRACLVPDAVAPANAVFDATGKRLTTVPFTRDRLRAALG